jgi:TonB-dependent SusC/RagA subfamily outer membrane receptor
MKAYLVDASSFHTDTTSKEIYVDLIDFNNLQVRSIILRNQKGFGYGDLALGDTLIEGNYQLRCYTNWMRNFDNDFFFSKSITIKNPNYENVVTREKLKAIKTYNRKFERFENDKIVYFFPEGGNLVAGFSNRIAFKAMNNLGLGIDIHGTLLDEKKNQLAVFGSIHNGMGVFEFTPEAGKKYFAEISYAGGKKDKMPLPQVMNNGFTMSAEPFGENIKVTIRSNRPSSSDIVFNEVIVIAQSRGIVKFETKKEIKDVPLVLTIPKNTFPAGITQITLFDGRNEPQCERLIFIKPQYDTEYRSLNLVHDKKEDSIFYTIKFNSSEALPESSNLSMAVTEFDTTKNADNISTHLLLTSDLKGRIENPSFYFEEDEPNAEKYVDLIMLTNGWRRFIWKDLLADKFPPVQYSPSAGLSIDGKIVRDHFEIPIPNSKVRLSILSSYNDQFETTTDRRGMFLFKDLNYEDSINVKIEAFKPAGGKAGQIILGDTVIPVVTTKTYPVALKTEFNRKSIKANTRRETIAFKKNYKQPEPNIQGSKIHNTPNDVLTVGDDVGEYSNILQYLAGRVAGVNVAGNSVIIRGVGTINGSTDPLFLLDGIPIEASNVSSLNPSDIAYIEILKGPDAAIYGVRGANGVIAFYSKRGNFVKRGVIEFGMLGYYKAREFYIPKYDSWNYKPTAYNVPRTMYWKSRLIPNSKGTIRVGFKNHLNISNYTVTIEGITSEGKIVYYKK